MHWERIRVFLFLCVISLPAFVFGDSFTAFVPTNYLNPAEQRYDALRVEIPEMAPNELGEVLSETTRTKKIVLYVPSSKSKEDLKASLENVMAQMRESRKPRLLEVRTFGSTENPHLHRVTQELQRAFNQKIEVGRTYDPVKAQKWINRVSAINGAMGAGGRLGQIAYTGSTPDTAGDVGALGLIAYNGLISYYGTKYETWLGKKLSNHGLLKLPWLKETRGFKGLDNFYTNSRSMRFLKGAIGNFLLWGLASNSANQVLSHMNSRENELPGSGDIGRWYVMSFISAPLYYLYFNGFQKAVQRGWIRNDILEKYLRANDFVFQTTMVPNTSGNSNIQKFLGVLMGTYWGMQAVPAAVMNFLPVKNDRLVLVDSEIKDPSPIKQLEGIDETRLPASRTKESILEAFRNVEDLKPVRSLKEKLKCALGFSQVSAQ